MQALLKHAKGPGNIELRNVPEPQILPNQVKIRVKAAGICGTDIHILHDRFRNRPPVIVGHEYAGEIVETGSNVKKLRTGNRVVAGNPAHTCGNCFYCKMDNPYLCAEYIGRGYFIDGGLAEYVAVEEDCCHVIPDGVSFEQASLCEPLAGVLHGLTERISIKPGNLVLICGAGSIGILSAKVAMIQGAIVLITGLSRDQHRLKIAKEMGVDAVINIETENLKSIVSRFSVLGPDIVVECAGSKRAFNEALEIVRKGGTVLQLGIYPGVFETDVNQLVMKELSVLGTYGQSWQCWETALGLMQNGKIDMNLLIDDIMPLTQWRKGFELMESGKALKVILKP